MVRSPGTVGRRIRWLWRSATRIWRQPAALVAVIGSFALPALAVTAAALLHEQAVDQVAQRAVADDATGLDVVVVAEGSLTETAVAALDDEVTARLSRWPAAASTERTLIVPQNAATVGRPIVEADGSVRPEPIIGGGARVVARDGALDAVRVVADAGVDGLWISERYAERAGLWVGDQVVVGASAPVTVAGVFEDLWEPGQDDYWVGAPSVIVPNYSRVLRAPTFEVILADEQVLLDLGVNGVVRWDTAVGGVDTIDGLRAQTAAATRFRRSATESASFGAAVAGFAGPGGPRPEVQTDAFDLLASTESSADALGGPLLTATVGAAALGLLVIAVGASFATRRRLDEIRLMRGDGDGLPRLAVGAIGEYALPATLGAALGVVVARAIFGGTFDAGVDVEPAVLVAASAGLVIVGGVTAFVAARSLDETVGSLGRPRLAWFLPLVAIAAAGWVQLGDADDTDGTGLVLVALPIAALLGGVGALTVGARALAGRAHFLGRRLPSPLFLAWRRTIAAGAGPALLATGLGVSLGLVVLAVSISTSMTASTEAKATTIVGGVTNVTASPTDRPPPGATAIREWTTKSTVTDDSVHVLVIDPATYATAVSWDRSFGSSPRDVVETLTSATPAGDIPAIVAGPRPVATEGGVGTADVITYSVVDQLASAPLASSAHPTLIVSGPLLVEQALENHRQRRPDEIEPAAWDAEFRSPVRGSTVFVSQLDAPQFAVALRASGIDGDAIVTRAAALGALDDAVVNANLDLLRMLAAVAAVAALGALAFSQVEQHTRRRVSTVMVRRMGMSKRSAVVAAGGEIAGATALAFAAGAAIALGVSSRLFPFLEPDRVVPPDIAAVIPWAAIAAVGAALALVVVVTASASARAIERTSYAEVLRDR